MLLAFITGPVRSGKSTFAQNLATKQTGAVWFIATGPCSTDDPEWTHRVERHRRDRPADWPTIETARIPFDDVLELLASAPPDAVLIIDSLGTWLAKEIGITGADADLPRLERDCAARGMQLISACVTSSGRVIIVSEETGWGIVPSYPAGRLFRDIQGRLNRELARVADNAFLVVCGRAIDLKQAPATEEARC